MQYKRIWMPYKTEAKTSNVSGMVIVEHSPCDDENTEKADKEIAALLANGWQIVSTCPVNESSNILNRDGDDVYASYTRGIEVFMIKA